MLVVLALPVSVSAVVVVVVVVVVVACGTARAGDSSGSTSGGGGRSVRTDARTRRLGYSVVYTLPFQLSPGAVSNPEPGGEGDQVISGEIPKF
jgi:hypothetical protein